MLDRMSGEHAHRVVVVGGGFGGLQAVQGLRRVPVDVTLVDRQNYTLFQPLVYQVATGALSSAEIAAPLRMVFRRQRNVRVLLAEVTGFDLERREIVLDHLPNGDKDVRLGYDTLIVAGGSRYSYFGHDEWNADAPELKSLAGALDIRNRILSAFEAAEAETDPELRQAWLTFVVVGAGPTGVEMAGQIAELAHDSLRHDFRASDPRTARVLLVEAADRVLPAFPESLSQKAADQLEELGVTPLIRHTVVDVSSGSVAIKDHDGTVEDVAARTSRASRLRSEPQNSAPRRGSTSTAPAGSRSHPTSPSPGTRRCWHSATWSGCALPTARSPSSRASPPSRSSRVGTRRAPSAPACAGAHPSHSTTGTRATSPRSAARRPWPTSRGSTSPAFSRGCSGSSSTSSI
jgi:hypothetical protein